MMLGASHENHEWGVRLNSHEFDRLKAVPDSPVKEKGRREKFNFPQNGEDMQNQRVKSACILILSNNARNESHK